MGSNRVCTINHKLSTINTYYYHPDHIGSSNVITDAAGQQVQHIEYTPYGSLASSLGPASFALRHLFTGKELDDTGLYYYGARYYDPQIGRFITPDTIVQAPYDPQSLNRYSYCRNNPINYIDPTGHKWSWTKFWHSVVAGVASGVTFALTGGNIALAGMVFGAVSGAFEGGVKGALMGAAIGGAMGMGIGAGMSICGPMFGWAVLGGSVAYTAATQGGEGLGYMAGGIAGSMAGASATSAVKSYFSSPNNAPNLATQRGSAGGASQKTNAQAQSALTTDQKPEIRPGSVNRGHYLKAENTNPETGIRTIDELYVNDGKRGQLPFSFDKRERDVVQFVRDAVSGLNGTVYFL